jgi:hypothetical protein
VTIDELASWLDAAAEDALSELLFGKQRLEVLLSDESEANSRSTPMTPLGNGTAARRGHLKHLSGGWCCPEDPAE